MLLSAMVLRRLARVQRGTMRREPQIHGLLHSMVPRLISILQEMDMIMYIQRNL